MSFISLSIKSIEEILLPLSKAHWHVNCIAIGKEIFMKDSNRRILLIEPDARERRSLTAFLKKENYEVETGKGLTDAIKKISDGCFSCLIMEVDLPEMKGYEAVSVLKNLDPHIHIIMMTKKNTKQLEKKVREQDIFFYFIKSFGNEELNQAIRSAISH